jgi:DNA-binding PadR family transcriptional regulator
VVKGIFPGGEEHAPAGGGGGLTQQQDIHSGWLEGPSALAARAARGGSVLYAAGCKPGSLHNGGGEQTGVLYGRGSYTQGQSPTLNSHMKTHNTPNAAPDGRVTAQKNELDILTNINRFGWLRSRDLAALIWPEAKTIDSAMAMAQRTLKRLKDDGQILHRIAPDGATVYALSEAGARRLGEERGILARSGKDLIRELGNYEHRCYANIFAIHRITAGQRVWTEREIQTRRAPIRAVKNKIPDGLVDLTGPLHAPDITVLGWVEVERGYKKKADFDKMLAFIFHILGSLDSQGRPSDDMFCAEVDVYIEQAIIQIASADQLNRIVGAVRAEKLANPYGYGWQYISAQFFLAGLAGTMYPISTWLA